MSSDTSPTASVSNALTPRSYWIIGAREDLLLFLGTPLLLLAVFAFAERFWGLTALTVFSTILAMGHYLPGLMRAYGDPALFQRFRWRFIVAPVVLIGTALLMSQRESHAFMVLVVVWGAWHWLMQTYGLVRIYDAKARNFDQTSARLDYALCIAWFGVLYWYTDGASAVLIRLTRASGAIAPDLFQWVSRIWFAATLAISVLYALNLIRCFRQGSPPSPLKLALMVISFLFYLYAFGYSSSKLIAFALFEGYHDIQYLAIVWIFNRGRVEKDPAAGAFTRFLFQQRAPLIILYVLLCVGFGSYDYLARQIDEGWLARTALGLITGFALVHFYFDGFIWRMRESSTRATLGVEAKDEQKKKARISPALRHLLICSSVAVPIVLLFMLESSGKGAADVMAYRTMLKVRPESHKAEYMLSMALARHKQVDEAIAHAERARELRPGYDLYDMQLADLLLGKGDDLTSEQLNEVIGCYKNAAVTRPDNATLQLNLAYALRRANRNEEAAERFKIVTRLKPNDPTSHFEYARHLFNHGQWELAKHACMRTLQLNDHHFDASFLLGMIGLAQGSAQESFGNFETALRLQPNNIEALTKFALALASVPDPKLQDRPRALQLVDRACSLSESKDPNVLQIAATVYGANQRFDEAMKFASQAKAAYEQKGQLLSAKLANDAIARFRQEQIEALKSAL